LLYVVLAAGCGGSEQGGSPDAGGDGDGDGGPTACETSVDCGADAPVCDDDGLCVECVVNADCIGDPDAPICDRESRTCQGCAEHSDCGSLVCDRSSGACAAEADVIYADAEAGADGPDCGSPSAPCATIGDALAKLTDTRRSIKLLGATTFPEVRTEGLRTRRSDRRSPHQRTTLSAKLGTPGSELWPPVLVTRTARGRYSGHSRTLAAGRGRNFERLAVARRLLLSTVCRMREQSFPGPRSWSPGELTGVSSCSSRGS
jgi:hypothetical protein